jgi:threonine/homoserine/homoserine lactone efflux protein
MNPTLWLSFAATFAILAITPGPSVLLATANSMNHGSRKTIATILGDLTANTLQITLASLGLATIITTSEPIFNAIKWVGVAYLVYMGTSKLLTKSAVSNLQVKKSEKSFFKLFSEGFLMSASNPKAIVFIAAFFPLFIDQSLAFTPQVVILGLTYLVMDGICLLTYVHFSDRLKRYLEDSEKVHMQNKIIGSLLVFSGVMLSLVNQE